MEAGFGSAVQRPPYSHTEQTDMGDKGSKDKGKKEQQKKAQRTPEEKRKLRREKKASNK
jgi:hypothetical protein